jgi:hypothetical protein
MEAQTPQTSRRGVKLGNPEITVEPCDCAPVEQPSSRPTVRGRQPFLVVLRAIWRSLSGDIWRRCLSRSSIPTFCGISTGFADSDVSHLPFMACTSSPSEPGLAFMDRVSASNLSCLRQITPKYLRQIISKTTITDEKEYVSSLLAGIGSRE